MTVAGDDESWNKGILGSYSHRSGVYVHHAGGSILYVGQTTTGEWGTFGERLRREFQKPSSRNSFLFQLLSAQKAPIRSYLLDVYEIDKIFSPVSLQLSSVRKALILEQVLIGLHEPEGNRK